jgi:hypothetical protein
MREAVTKYAVANHSAACALEGLHRRIDALPLHRTAAAAAAQALMSE